MLQVLFGLFMIISSQETVFALTADISKAFKTCATIPNYKR